MRNINLIVIIIILNLASGCNSFSSPPPTSISIGTSSPEIIISPTPSLTPKIVITDQTSPTSSPTSGEYRNQQCLLTDTVVPLESVATGTIAIGDFNTPVYLLELGSQTRHVLSYQTKSGSGYHFYYGFDTSPNRNYLAYLEVFRDLNGDPQYYKVRVADSKGEVLAEQTIDMNDISRNWRWINNDTIQMFSHSTAQEGTVELYEPFKGELNKLTNDFPGLYQDSYLNPSIFMIDYSPDLEWAIYLAKQKLSGEGPGYGPVVLELTNQGVIWKAVGYGTGDSLPMWSPVGYRVAVVVEGKLYIVSRDGQVMSPPGLTEDEQLQSEKFAWSPDGHYIAFWLIRGADAKLMLYDTQNQKIIDYCIEDLGGGNSLIWSPDGTQFITDVVYQATETERGQYSLLVDVQNNKAYKVPSKPLAWMNTKP